MFKKYYQNYKKELFRLNDKPLTWSSKAALVVFAIFMFNLVGAGVYMQKRSVDSAYEQYGYQCINLAEKEKDREEDKNRKETYFQKYKVDHSWKFDDFSVSRYLNPEQIEDSFGKSDACRKLGEKYLKVSSDFEFKGRYQAIEKLKQELGNKESNVEVYEREYGNMLLEKIANQKKDLSILHAGAEDVKRKLKKEMDGIQSIKERIAVLENLHTIKSFQEFESYLKNHYQEILSGYEHAMRVHSLKEILAVYAFLIPAFLLAYFLYKRFKAKGYTVLSKLLVHTANIIGIYIIINLCTLIYQIIPKVVWKKIMALVTMYNLEIIFPVIGIVALIVIFGFVIYKIQKNSLLKEKINPTYLKGGGCANCGAKNVSGRFCRVCGDKLFMKCKVCKADIKSHSLFCSECHAQQS